VRAEACTCPAADPGRVRITHGYQEDREQVSGELLQALDEHPAVLVADMTATALRRSRIHTLTRAYPAE
jgi:small-conductance mechanosensitive channel